MKEFLIVKKNQQKRITKRKIANIAISSGLLFTSCAVPIAISLSQNAIISSAAVLDMEILSDIKASNTSGNTENARWTSDDVNKAVNFQITGKELVDASVITSGKKQAVLTIPTEMNGKVTPNGQATIVTNLTIKLSEIQVLNDAINAMEQISNIISKIASGDYGELSNVTINFDEVNQKLDAFNNLKNLGTATFNENMVEASDGTYISANIDDGLGLVVSQNITNALNDYDAAVQALTAKGTGIVGGATATAINAALTPVKGTVNLAVKAVLPLISAGGSAINQLADASVLGGTTVTLPTLVSPPSDTAFELSKNVDAKFVGSVVKSDQIDASLISTGNGTTFIYYGPKQSTVTTPTINSVTGDSKTGYVVAGKATPGNTVEIRNQQNEVIGNGTVDANGNFSINIPAGKATANESLSAIAKDSNNNESSPVGFTTPADPTTVAQPTVDAIDGNSKDSYTVTGKTDPGNTVSVKDPQGNVVGTATADDQGNYTATIPAGQVNPGDSLQVTSKDAAGNESTATTTQVPNDNAPTAPTVGGITGNSKDGYIVTEKTDPGNTVSVKDPQGNAVGTATADDQGNYTVTIPAGTVKPGDALQVTSKDAAGNESPATNIKTPTDPTVSTPTVDPIKGNSKDGYTVTGKTDPGNTVIIKDSTGKVVGSGTADDQGNYKVTIPAGAVKPGDTLQVISKDKDDNESSAISIKTPADSTTPAPPTVGGVTGNSKDGYTITGKTDPYAIVEIRDGQGNLLATGKADANGNYRITIPAGKVKPGDTLVIISRNKEGNESQTSFKLPKYPINNGNDSGNMGGDGSNGLPIGNGSG
ncbi:putative membrane protein [Melissococcus plutonius]|nr:putative membrane protein [Melissococcus plutonius]